MNKIRLDRLNSVFGVDKLESRLHETAVQKSSVSSICNVYTPLVMYSLHFLIHHWHYFIFSP